MLGSLLFIILSITFLCVLLAAFVAVILCFVSIVTAELLNTGQKRFEYSHTGEAYTVNGRPMTEEEKAAFKLRMKEFNDRMNKFRSEMHGFADRMNELFKF